MKNDYAFHYQLSIIVISFISLLLPTLILSLPFSHSLLCTVVAMLTVMLPLIHS